MVDIHNTKEYVISLLSGIPDPEIPVVSIIEMGMVNDVRFVNEQCEVVLTPTYMGCPAMKMIEDDIKATLKLNGIRDVVVSLSYQPAWTTDWITDDAREKLRKYGIAPPQHTSCRKATAVAEVVVCPRCGTTITQLISRYGSTACKALYKCLSCKEPFEYFKCF